MSSLRLLQGTLSLSSLLPVSCLRSKSLPRKIGFSSNLSSSSAFACAKTLDTKSSIEESSDSAHEKAPDSSLETTHTRTLKADVKSILECLNQEIMKSTIDCLPENEIGFEVIKVTNKTYQYEFLLKKQAAGETIEVWVDGWNHGRYFNEILLNVRKMDGTCLEFFCERHEEKFRIDSMLIKEQGHSPDIKDYKLYCEHYNHSAFRLMHRESDYWLGTYQVPNLFDDFIEGRGVNKSTAKWLENYIQNHFKMEKLRWLENVKHFFDK